MTNHRCMAMTLKPKPNHPNGRVQKNQNRKKLIKFGQMCIFDCNGVVPHKFLLQGRTVNEAGHLEVIRWLRKAIRQKRIEL